MVDSARLGAVVDECTAWASELVVEADGGGEGAEACEDSFSEAGEGAGAVAFEGEEVFAGPEDALDALCIPPCRGRWRTAKARFPGHSRCRYTLVGV